MHHNLSLAEAISAKKFISGDHLAIERKLMEIEEMEVEVEREGVMAWEYELEREFNQKKTLAEISRLWGGVIRELL